MSDLIIGFQSLIGSAKRIWRRFFRILLRADVRDVMLEFFKEAAVLVAVFPVLDVIVESFKPNGPHLTWQLVVWSEGIAGFLLLIACIMSGLAGE